MIWELVYTEPSRGNSAKYRYLAATPERGL